jgi:hypothetical protein
MPYHDAYFKIFWFRRVDTLVTIFVSDAYFADDEGNSRFNGSLYESALCAPRLEEAVAIQELRFTQEVIPAARVKEVFSQFIPNEGRRAKTILFRRDFDSVVEAMPIIVLKCP